MGMAASVSSAGSNRHRLGRSSLRRVGVGGLGAGSELAPAQVATRNVKVRGSGEQMTVRMQPGDLVAAADVAGITSDLSPEHVELMA